MNATLVPSITLRGGGCASGGSAAAGEEAPAFRPERLHCTVVAGRQTDKNDKRRPYWILETTRYIIEALKHDVPVKGMLLWSLVNNFEWNLGMQQKFGLFDEAELRQELKASPVGEIRGWEVWRAVTKAVTNPSPETLQELQAVYETAKRQFEENV